MKRTLHFTRPSKLFLITVYFIKIKFVKGNTKNRTTNIFHIDIFVQMFYECVCEGTVLRLHVGWAGVHGLWCG